MRHSLNPVDDALQGLHGAAALDVGVRNAGGGGAQLLQLVGVGHGLQVGDQALEDALLGVLRLRGHHDAGGLAALVLGELLHLRLQLLRQRARAELREGLGSQLGHRVDGRADGSRQLLALHGDSRSSERHVCVDADARVRSECRLCASGRKSLHSAEGRQLSEAVHNNKKLTILVTNLSSHCCASSTSAWLYKDTAPLARMCVCTPFSAKAAASARFAALSSTSALQK